MIIETGTYTAMVRPEKGYATYMRTDDGENINWFRFNDGGASARHWRKIDIADQVDALENQYKKEMDISV